MWRRCSSDILFLGQGLPGVQIYYWMSFIHCINVFSLEYSGPSLLGSSKIEGNSGRGVIAVE